MAVKSRFGSVYLRLLRRQVRSEFVIKLNMRPVIRHYSTESAEHKVSNSNWKCVFSGIQPTGTLHLGNYFGAVHRWTEMQNHYENFVISIVDMHAITLPQKPEELRNNIMKMAASLLACGIDPDKTVLFQQSMVPQHAELSWIIGCLTTMARLSHLPQYQEKSAKTKNVPLGLFVYPVLQCADILLYRATDVPVGEDQLHHIHLAQHLVNVFNKAYGQYFPFPNALLGNKNSARIKSLRDPTKKMSKSDADQRSRIELTDSADVIREKVKKAVTDLTSAVTYEPESRTAVANLINIHSLLSGLTHEQICNEVKDLDTAHYKLRLVDIVNSFVTPIRTRIEDLLNNRDYLEQVLRLGSCRANEIADKTWNDVKKLVGFI